MSQIGIFVRPATAADRTGIVALAPRLAEGVAPWRDQREAGNAGRRWLEGSLDDAAAGTGAVFVAVDGAAAAEAAANTATAGNAKAGGPAEDSAQDSAGPAAKAAAAYVGEASRADTAGPAAQDAAAGPAPSVGGGVVGVLSIRPVQHFTGERDGYIGELVVAEHVGRRGIGRSLIAAAEAWARGQGLAHLTLHTGAYNASARAFYAALGFAEEEVRLTRPLPPA